MKAVFQPTKDGFRLSISTGRKETEAAFFPADQDIVDNPAPQTIAPSAKGLVLDLKKDANIAANPAQLKGVVELSGGRAFEIVAVPGDTGAAASAGPTSGAKAPDGTAAVAGVKTPAYQAQAGAQGQLVAPGANSAVAAANSTPAKAAPKQFSGSGLLRAAGLAFIGGVMLNLMPCVFPVLFLKGLALVNSGNEERHKLRIHGSSMPLGFWFRSGCWWRFCWGCERPGATLGWGFQFQSPVFLALMAGLLFFLGLSLAGQFEIGLTLTSAGGSLAAKQGYAGSFFTGVLAVWWPRPAPLR